MKKAPPWADAASPQGTWPREHGVDWIYPHATAFAGVLFCRAQPTYPIALIFTVHLLFSFSNIMDKETTMFFKLSICNFQQYLDNIPLSEIC